MPEVAGYLNQTWILAGTVAMTNSTGAKIAGVDKTDYGNLCDILEISAFGDTYKNRMAGLKDSTFKLSGNLYTGDTTGQDVLVPGNTVFIGVYPSGTGVAGKQVKAIVESVDWAYDVAGKDTFNASLACCAAPVALPLRP